MALLLLLWMAASACSASLEGAGGHDDHAAGPAKDSGSHVEVGSASDARSFASPDQPTDGGGQRSETGVDVERLAPVDECSAAQADWVFCDSFESTTTYDGNKRTATIVADPGPFGLAGNHAAQLRVPAGRGGTGLYKELTPQLEVGYLRYYVMWEPGHDFTAARHGPGGFHGGNTDCIGCSGNRPSDWLTATLETVTKTPVTLQAYTYYPGMYMDCSNPSGACWGDMFPCTAGPGYCTKPAHAARGDEPTIEAGRWYCLEQMIDVGRTTSSASGADGVLNFWVDGKSIGPWAGLWLRSREATRLSAIWLNLFHHDGHSAEGLRIDNVVVSRSRVGCGR